MRPVRLLVAGAVAWSLVGCQLFGDVDRIEPRVESCEPGQTAECGCSGGATGRQRCLTDGTYGICQCSGADAGDGGAETDGGACDGFCLDPTFDGDGALVVDTLAGEVDFSSQGVALQKDGKIVVVGNAGDADTSDFLVIRLHSDGRFDEDFGDNGLKRVDLGTPGDRAKSVIVQPDGKIVAAGIAGDGGGVVRLEADGRLDAGFGGSEIPGVRRVKPSDSNRALFNGIALQSDGRLVMGGQALSKAEGAWDFFLARVGTVGDLDADFADGGVLLDDVLGGDEFGNRPHILVSGHILFSGSTYVDADGSFDCAVTRHDSGGEPVEAFGEGGDVTVDLAGQTDRCSTLQVYPDGSILAGGYGTREDGTTDFMVTRLKGDGERETAFGDEGIQTVDFGGEERLRSFVLLDEMSPPRVLAGGFTDDGEHESMALAMFRDDGTLDPSFGEGGTMTLDIDEGTDDQIHYATLDAQGRVLLFGTSYNGITERLVLLRFTI